MPWFRADYAGEGVLGARHFMIELSMYFGIGFFGAALAGLLVIPFVHGRAVRLTQRRLEAAIPTSIAAIQADKDHLRADFALATRRLEMSVESLKTKSASQLAELGKNGEAINRFKIELGEKTATIFALEARDKSLRDQLRAAEEEIAFKTSAMYDAQRAHSEKKAELAKLIGELDELSTLADSQKVEIMALKSQVDAIKARDAILLSVMGSPAARPLDGLNGAHTPASADVWSNN